MGPELCRSLVWNFWKFFLVLRTRQPLVESMGSAPGTRSVKDRTLRTTEARLPENGVRRVGSTSTKPPTRARTVPSLLVSSGRPVTTLHPGRGQNVVVRLRFSCLLDSRVPSHRDRCDTNPGCPEDLYRVDTETRHGPPFTGERPGRSYSVCC